MRGEDDGKFVFWVGKFLLLFLLKTTISGTGRRKDEAFSYVQFMYACWLRVTLVTALIIKEDF